MKKTLTRCGLIGLAASLGVSCTTAYDRQGRAHKVVTPEGALLGAAAAGVLAYQLGKDKKKRYYRNGYYNGGYYGHDGYRRGGRYYDDRRYYRRGHRD